MEKRFKSHSLGQIDDLCELRLEADGAATDPTYPLRAFVAISEAELPLKDHTYRVGTLRAELVVNFEGCETVMGSVFGQAQLGDLETVESRVSETKVEGKATGQLSAFPLLGSASAQGEAGAAMTERRETTRRTKSAAVQYRTNGRWKIQDPTIGGQPSAITGTALNNDVIAEVQPVEGSNRMRLEGTVTTSKRDLIVECMTGNSLMRHVLVNRNREAIIAAVVAKAVQRGLNGEEGRGGSTLPLARVEVAE